LSSIAIGRGTLQGTPTPPTPQALGASWLRRRLLRGLATTTQLDHFPSAARGLAARPAGGDDGGVGGRESDSASGDSDSSWAVRESPPPVLVETSSSRLGRGAPLRYLLDGTPHEAETRAGRVRRVCIQDASTGRVTVTTLFLTALRGGAMPAGSVVVDSRWVVGADPPGTSSLHAPIPATRPTADPGSGASDTSTAPEACPGPSRTPSLVPRRRVSLSTDGSLDSPALGSEMVRSVVLRRPGFVPVAMRLRLFRSSGSAPPQPWPLPAQASETRREAARGVTAEEEAAAAAVVGETVAAGLAAAAREARAAAMEAAEMAAVTRAAAAAAVRAAAEASGVRSRPGSVGGKGALGGKGSVPPPRVYPNPSGRARCAAARHARVWPRLDAGGAALGVCIAAAVAAALLGGRSLIGGAGAAPRRGSRLLAAPPLLADAIAALLARVCAAAAAARRILVAQRILT